MLDEVVREQTLDGEPACVARRRPSCHEKAQGLRRTETPDRELEGARAAAIDPVEVIDCNYRRLLCQRGQGTADGHPEGTQVDRLIARIGPEECLVESAPFRR